MCTHTAAVSTICKPKIICLWSRCKVRNKEMSSPNFLGRINTNDKTILYFTMMKKIDVSFLRRGYKKAKEGRTRRLESFGQGIKILKYLQSVDISSFHHKQGSSYKELTNNIYQLRGYSFSTYSKFSKKLTFLTPFYAHVGVCKMG